MFYGSPIVPETMSFDAPPHFELLDRKHLPSQRCVFCYSWVANPLGYLLGQVRKPRLLMSHYIEKSIESWKSGAERGCLLGKFVVILCQDVERHLGSKCAQDIQVLVGPIREDFPIYIQVARYGSKDGVRAKMWEVELYTTKDAQSPLPGLPMRREMATNFGSKQCLQLIQTWLRECKAKHTSEGCNLEDEQCLPTRVLDISFTPPRLLLANGQRGHFVALSHCWGNSSHPPPRTLASNLREYCEYGVPDNCLSATFRDAIIMSRNLGYRYIWVDSLCIIQDDSKDWEHESGLMAAVYGRADLVIGATSAGDGSKGFLNPRPHYFQGTVHLPTPNEYEYPSWEISYRSCPPHIPYSTHHEVCRPESDGPLEDRAWAFQERVLARRFVSFGIHEVCWECNALLECECFTVHDCELDSENFSDRTFVPIHTKYNLRRKLNQNISSRQLHDAWRRNVVQPYTQRQLTRSSDGLVAMSAIAYEFSTRLSSQYLAGIWRDDLQRGLIWQCTDVTSTHVLGTPSWSWASVQSPISWLREKFDPAVCPEAVRVDYATSPDNVFGEPLAASLTFRAKVFPKAELILSSDGGLEDSLRSTYKLRLSKANLFEPLMDMDVEPVESFRDGESLKTSARRRRSKMVGVIGPQQENVAYEGVHCLHMGLHIVLILGPTSSQSGIFERLGICYVPGADIRSWKEREITIA